jgi:hypothetical protein
MLLLGTGSLYLGTAQRSLPNAAAQACLRALRPRRTASSQLAPMAGQEWIRVRGCWCCNPLLTSLHLGRRITKSECIRPLKYAARLVRGTPPVLRHLPLPRPSPVYPVPPAPSASPAMARGAGRLLGQFARAYSTGNRFAARAGEEVAAVSAAHRQALGVLDVSICAPARSRRFCVAIVERPAFAQRPAGRPRETAQRAPRARPPAPGGHRGPPNAL